ncbi:branched-chain amino acid transporter permease [Streptomyces sp. NPDC093064]|uniref:branched-chain amino acid transporter permease n=1 Tax=Streptomyces sp. NPDC093064 TaxID=3366020 RepID=UPI00382C0AB8
MAVAVSDAVTWALRALPFTVLASLRASRTVQYLGARMPAGVMVILFVYCLRDLPLTQSRAAAPLAALAVTVGLHLWCRGLTRCSHARPRGCGSTPGHRTGGVPVPCRPPRAAGPSSRA